MLLKAKGSADFMTSGQSRIGEMGGRVPSLSPPFPSLPLPSLPLPLPFPLRSRASQRSIGERCKLSQRIWCILALKSDIRWPQF